MGIKQQCYGDPSSIIVQVASSMLSGIHEVIVNLCQCNMLIIICKFLWIGNFLACP